MDARPNNTAQTAKPLYEVVAENLVARLGQGLAPWQISRAPNATNDFMPTNPVTGKRFHGINALHLMAQGRSDPRWMTYDQARKLGAQVRRGEKSTKIQSWIFKKEVDKLENGRPVIGPDGKPEKVTVKLERPQLVEALVFNAEQVEGLPAREAIQNHDAGQDRIARVERLLRSSGAKVAHDDGKRASYRASTDTITLPGKAEFADADDYYTTTLRQLALWTGHPDRLNRDLANPPGSDAYAREALRTEIASMLLAAELGMGHNPGPNAAYVGSWIKTLQNDPLEVFRAAQDAEKIVKLVMAYDRQETLAPSAQQSSTPANAPDLARSKEPPFMLVRVQDALHGASVDAAGLHLPYQRDNEFGAARNTIHWSVNSTVSDHAYGRFNEDANGNLTGKVVILADPREMPVPAGLGQVDTWFRLTARPNGNGAIERGIDVGRSAVLVLPEGMDAPDGVEVVRYVGGLAERDRAVQSVLESRNVSLQTAGMWGWTGYGQGSEEWAAEIASKHYAGNERAIRTGMHSGSIDEQIESLATRISSHVKQFEESRFFVTSGGAEIPFVDVIQGEINEQRAYLNEMRASLPDTEQMRVGAFYTLQDAQLDTLLARALEIEQTFLAQLADSELVARTQLPQGDAPQVTPPLRGPAPVADRLAVLRARRQQVAPGTPIRRDIDNEIASIEKEHRNDVKWFGTQGKADAFIAKRGLGDTHHVVETTRNRFEILPRAASTADQNPDPLNIAISEVVSDRFGHFTSYRGTSLVAALEANGIRSLREAAGADATDYFSAYEHAIGALSPVFGIASDDSETSNAYLERKGLAVEVANLSESILATRRVEQDHAAQPTIPPLTAPDHTRGTLRERLVDSGIMSSADAALTAARREMQAPVEIGENQSGFDEQIPLEFAFADTLDTIDRIREDANTDDAETPTLTVESQNGNATELAPSAREENPEDRDAEAGEQAAVQPLRMEDSGALGVQHAGQAQGTGNAGRTGDLEPPARPAGDRARSSDDDGSARRIGDGSGPARDSGAARGSNGVVTLPDGWLGTVNGLATNTDPVHGGIVDQNAEGWFVVPETSGIDVLEGYPTQMAAIGALADAVAAKQSAQAGERSVASAPRPAAAADYIITDADQLGVGGAKTKYRDNVAAIRVLRQLQEEGRAATQEEQAKLVRYVGWGGLPQAFDMRNSDWAKEFKELAALLPQEEYEAARRSTQDAHYTSETIIKGIYEGVQRFGFEGGRIFEPSSGVGHFIGLQPSELRANSTTTAVELDPTTAGIAKALYPTSTVINRGFQEVAVPSNMFDLVVGNPPFGNQKLYDPRHKDLSDFSIHNYFIAKSLDAVRPGGVVAVVVSNFFMDAGVSPAREHIADRANLVGAIRLPNNAFKQNAMTEVTTDIVFLQKLHEGQVADRAWLNVGAVKDEATGNDIPLNEYFVKHPEMMLGRMALEGTMYAGGQPALVGDPNVDLAAELQRAISKLPANIYSAAQDDQQQADAREAREDVSVPADVKIGAFFVTPSGRIAVREDDLLDEPQFRWAELKNERAGERIKGMVEVRTALRSLMAAERTDRHSDEEIESRRTALNAAYDDFVKKHGFISSQVNKQAFSEDPEYALLHSLERDYDRGVSREVARKNGVGAREPSARKAEIFTQRVMTPNREITRVETAKDALVVSMNETGKVDMELMVRLSGKPEDELVRELPGLIFQTPQGKWETADRYLSGNVKLKLAEVEAAQQTDRRFAANVEALQRVQPADIEAVDISVQLGSTWVPADVVNDFVTHTLGDVRRTISYQPSLGKWLAQIGSSSDHTLMTSTWGTGDIPANELLANLLGGKAIQVKEVVGRLENGQPEYRINEERTAAANQKADELRQAFGDWIWEDKTRRERLARLYNDTFNTNVPPRYDGSHLVLPGSSRAITLRPHQKDAIWRGIQEGTALFDHVVGAGKTMVVIGTMMESKRMGLINKPMIAVPNHLLLQWKDAFFELYPGANVLVAEKHEFKKENREKLFAKIATGNWDAVVVAHSSFKKIGVPEETLKEILNEQIDDLTDSILKVKQDRGDRVTIKEMEKARDRMKAKLERQAETGAKDRGVDFADLGVDALAIDEMHEFKNLFINTSMTRVAGLGNLAGSDKAFDMFVKVRYIQKENEGRGLYGATGTPISNTIAEMFTVQRYMHYDEMKKRGIVHFDAWASTFGQVVTGWELDATGVNYRLNSRFSKFQNVPELTNLYRTFADTITQRDLQAQAAAQGRRFPVPKVRGGKPQNIIVDRTDQQASYMGIQTPVLDHTGQQATRADGSLISDWNEGSIIHRMENLPDDPRIDNPLKITNDARKAGLDYRLIDPDATDSPDTKVNQAVDRIVAKYEDWNERRGTQLVFCDLSTPKAKRGAVEAPTPSDENDDGPEAPDEEQSISMDELLAGGGKFSVYDDMRAKLIARGIPEDQIAFIHDYNTDTRKQKLFAEMNAGTKRVLFGSTAKMGAGTNVQRRLVAVHHLDAPWRPSDLEQREGRILRQGNMFYDQDPDGFEVEVLRYSTKQTYDARMWQTIQSKAEGIEQFRRGDSLQRVIEDVASEAANAAEMKAAATGNPLIFQQVQIAADLKKMEAVYSNYRRNKYSLESHADWLSRADERADREVAEARAEMNLRDRNTTEEFAFYRGNSVFSKEQNSEMLGVVMDSMKGALIDAKDGIKGAIEVGVYRGFKIEVQAAGRALQFTLHGNEDHSPGNLIYRDADDFKVSGLFTKIDNYLASIDSRVSDAEEARVRQTEELSRARAELEKPFAQAQKLDMLRKDMGDVIAELKKSQADPSYVSAWEPVSYKEESQQAAVATKSPKVVESSVQASARERASTDEVGAPAASDTDTGDLESSVQVAEAELAEALVIAENAQADNPVPRDWQGVACQEFDYEMEKVSQKPHWGAQELFSIKEGARERIESFYWDGRTPTESEKLTEHKLRRDIVEAERWLYANVYLNPVVKDKMYPIVSQRTITFKDDIAAFLIEMEGRAENSHQTNEGPVTAIMAQRSQEGLRAFMERDEAQVSDERAMFSEAAHNAFGFSLPDDWNGHVEIRGLIERDGAVQWAEDHDAQPEFFGLYVQRGNAAEAPLEEWVRDFETEAEALEVKHRLVLIEAYAQESGSESYAMEASVAADVANPIEREAWNRPTEYIEALATPDFDSIQTKLEDANMQAEALVMRAAREGTPDDYEIATKVQQGVIAGKMTPEQNAQIEALSAMLDGSQSERESPVSTAEKVWLDVPFSQKDAAKQIAGTLEDGKCAIDFDRTEKRWFARPGADLDPLAPWIPTRARAESAVQIAQPGRIATEITPLAVSFNDRETAKKLAGRLEDGSFAIDFDKANKTWYAKPGADLARLKAFLPENVQVRQEPAPDPLRDFTAALIAAGGIETEKYPVRMDGAWHRMKAVGDKSGETSITYRAFTDGTPNGHIKNKRANTDDRWFGKGQSMSDDERAKLAAENAAKMLERERQQLQLETRRAATIEALYNVAPQAPADHGYAIAKGIDVSQLRMVPQDVAGLPEGCNVFIGSNHKEARALRESLAESNPDALVFTAGDLLLPAYDGDGKLWSAQSIQPDGTKRFAKEARQRDCFCVANGTLEDLADAPAIVVSEGYATAKSVSKPLGFPTVSAFNAGNLPGVVKALHEQFPGKPVIVAGDDDAHTPNNAGREKAELAAKLVGGSTVFPYFAPGEREADPKGHTDFNDLEMKSILGAEGVARQVRAAVDFAIEKKAALAAEETQQLSLNRKAMLGNEPVTAKRSHGR